MEMNLITMMQQEYQIGRILEINSEISRYGLSLTEQQARQIVTARNDTLAEQRRVEFGPTIVNAIIREFCDSPYIGQENLTETITELQDLFFMFKNEMLDEITDDELLHFMREQFDGICGGDIEYLGGTVLPVFAQAVRAGYDGFAATDGHGEYAQFDEVRRWDPELYRQALKELAWE